MMQELNNVKNTSKMFIKIRKTLLLILLFGLSAGAKAVPQSKNFYKVNSPE